VESGGHTSGEDGKWRVAFKISKPKQKKENMSFVFKHDLLYFTPLIAFGFHTKNFFFLLPINGG
jgi:hypothetical protein